MVGVDVVDAEVVAVVVLGGSFIVVVEIGDDVTVVEVALEVAVVVVWLVEGFQGTATRMKTPRR